MPASMIAQGEATAATVDTTAEASDQSTVDNTAVVDSETTGNTADPQDPFGDLVEFKDPESGLYLGRYKNLKEVLAGNKELTQKLREKSPEPPESPDKYDIAFSQESKFKDFKLTMDDPMWKSLAPVFHSQKVSNEAASAIAEAFMDYSASLGNDVEAERAKLGSEAPQIISGVEAWVQKVGTGEKAMPGAKELAELAGQSAETLKAFYALIQSSGEKKIPATGNYVSGKTREEAVQEAFAYKDRHKDTIDVNPAQQAQYQKLMDEAFTLYK